MAKRLISVMFSVAGVIVSVIATFYEALNWYAFCKYEAGGTSYTVADLQKEFLSYCGVPLLVMFCGVVAGLILLAVLAQVNISKYKKVAVAKVIGGVAFFASIVLLYKYDIPGEGFAIFFITPIVLAVTAVQLVLFIIILAKNKSNASIVFSVIFFVIGILCSASIATLCDEPSVYATTTVITVSLANAVVLWLSDDETQKAPWWAIPTSVICILLAGAVAFGGVALHYDGEKRSREESLGIVYVGSNDGKEEERAHFSIDGFEGYYAQKEGSDNYYPYRYGDYSIVESYDFSSENIVVPATLGGKKVVFETSMTEPAQFFNCLAKNRDKFKTITFAEELDYTAQGGFVYSDRRKSKIVFYLGNKKDITVTEEVIGEYAFAYTDIEKVEFKNDDQLIAAGAFADCPIKEVVFPDNLSTTGDESVFGSAPELQSIKIGKWCNVFAPLGDFDEDVRRRNDKENITLTVDTDTTTDLYDLGTMIYNYPEVELNIHMSKGDYTDPSMGYGVSKKMMERISGDGSTFTFTDKHYESGGRAYRTEVTIRFDM